MLQDYVDFIRMMPGIYQLRRRRYERKFFSTTRECWGLCGAYQSMEHARQQVPDLKKSTYDDDDIVEVNLEWFSTLSLFDYPVLYWLSRLIGEHEVDSIVDFGGHVGVKYYAYSDRLQFPESFKWCVVDVPAMVQRGKEKARELGISHLMFIADIEAAPATKLLFCSGSLMYADLSIDQIVSKMVARPEYILINKLAVLPDQEVFSLEGFGVSRVPYHVFNLKQFNEAISKLNYELIDIWEIEDRTHEIPFVEYAQEVKSIGQVWKSCE